MIPRGRRVSMTFRHVVKPASIPRELLLTGEMEKNHVVEVYDAIALHWHHTRGKRKVHWQRVKSFIESLPPGTILADIGSGDGKYFGLNPHIVTVGCDRSWQLLKVSHESSHETFCCDAVSLPFQSRSFDSVICIAVLHHLATIERRFAVLSELIRIVNFGGVVFIQAWAFEQLEDSKHVFSSTDTMVPWKMSQRFALKESKGVVGSERSSGDHNEGKDVIYERYCHLYQKGELEDLCSRIPNCTITESGYERGNWFVKLQKVEDPRFSYLDNTGRERFSTIPGATRLTHSRK